MWPSPTVLHQQVHCSQVTLELRCWCSQLLPQMHPSHPALCWDWWAVNISYVGSAAPFLIPGAYHINLYIGIGPLFHYIFLIFSICPVSCYSPWRQLHGLKLCSQPPRPLLCFFVIVSFITLDLLSLGRLQPFSEPILHLSLLLHKCGGVFVVCGAKLRVTSTGRWGCHPYMR